MALIPGTRVGPYEIEAAIGVGGMGEVYRARDTKLDHDVSSRATLAAPMPERRKTVLIVDHDERMRNTLAAVLRRNYRPLKAATGETALQLMEKEDVDLMMLDVTLPGITGFEALKIVKEKYPDVEVIVMLVTMELDAAIEAMRHGAYHYVSKDSKDFTLKGVRTLVGDASWRQELNRHIMRLKADIAEQMKRSTGDEPATLVDALL